MWIIPDVRDAIECNGDKSLRLAGAARVKETDEACLIVVTDSGGRIGPGGKTRTGLRSVDHVGPQTKLTSNLRTQPCIDLPELGVAGRTAAPTVLKRWWCRIRISFVTLRSNLVEG